jgi:hypothetical protein
MKDSAYVTDYFYFAVRQDKKDGRDVLVYSSGVNLDRFLPMMRGRLGLGSNPILSGLQLVKYDLCRLALSKGAVPRDQHGSTRSAADVTLSEGAWYVEPLLIENPSGILPEEIVAFCVDSYVRRVAACSLQKYDVPDSVLPPGEMQAQLQTLCNAA